jgi:Flp pilus assembly protein CpaB
VLGVSGGSGVRIDALGLRRPRRASTYFLLGVVLVCIGGGVYLWWGVGSREIYAAAVDLPAYHQITQADVRLTPVRSSDVPPDATADRDDLIGHYTLSEVRQDRPFHVDQLGPELTAGALNGQRIAALTASATEVGGGILRRGDRVDVLLSSTASVENPRNGILRQVLILDLRSDDKQAVLVLALSTGDEETLLTAGGTARIFVARVASHNPP